ncbi:MAG: tetratricopeptide repeat protein [Acidobacteriota bacterium]
MQNLPEAEKVLREAAELREKNLPKEHFLTALTNGALGECLMTQKKYAEAEPLLKESFESLKISQGTDNPRTETARRQLVSFYESVGKTDSANEYRKKVL